MMVRAHGVRFCRQAQLVQDASRRSSLARFSAKMPDAGQRDWRGLQVMGGLKRQLGLSPPSLSFIGESQHHISRGKLRVDRRRLLTEWDSFFVSVREVAQPSRCAVNHRGRCCQTSGLIDNAKAFVPPAGYQEDVCKPMVDWSVLRIKLESLLEILFSFGPPPIEHEVNLSQCCVSSGTRFRIGCQLQCFIDS